MKVWRGEPRLTLPDVTEMKKKKHDIFALDDMYLNVFKSASGGSGWLPEG